MKGARSWNPPEEKKSRKSGAAETRDDAIVIFSTAGKEQAGLIARMLVDRRLAACVNITAVQSHYRWEGEFCEDSESLLLIKTTRGRMTEAMSAIREVHSYDLPEMIALPIMGGYPPYLQWLVQETSP
jgi:periplasmic divalent cation tolerance protein